MQMNGTVELPPTTQQPRPPPSTLTTLPQVLSALSRKVSVTARTAERVGGRVRTLDEEMRRVREASDRVQQVMELKVRLLFFSFPAEACSHTLSICTSHHCPLFSRQSTRKIGNRRHDIVHGPWPSPRA